MQIGGASTHATKNGGKDDGAVRRVEENEKVEGEKGKLMERLVQRDSSEKDGGSFDTTSTREWIHSYTDEKRPE